MLHSFLAPTRELKLGGAVKIHIPGFSAGKRGSVLKSAITALLIGGMYASASHAQTPLPDTQAEIETEMRVKAALGGGKVLVAPGIIDVLELRVPSNVTLVGSGALGSPRTTFRLKARTDGRAVVVGLNTIGNAIENVIVDGNRQNQSPSQYTLVDGKQVLVARVAPLTLGCTNCAARYVNVINSMADGVLVVDGKNIYILKTSTSNTGRFGFFISQKVNGVRVHYSRAQDTGMEMRYIGGAAGFGAGGTNVEIRFAETRRTNGDGVAAYSGSNLDIKVLDSTFYAPKNHCVHLGGDRPVMMRNKCYSPRLVGFYLANDFRPGAIEERNGIGGRVIGNRVENSGADGIKIQWYVSDTQITSNTVIKSFNNNFGIYDSLGVSVSGNTGMWPAAGRSGGDYCHLKIFNSRVTQSKNDFEYAGRTRPLVC